MPVADNLATRPFAGPEVVLKSLARSTHRVAIRNGRLRRLDGEQVEFAVKDYLRGGQRRLVRLSADEFVAGQFAWARGLSLLRSM